VGAGYALALYRDDATLDADLQSKADIDSDAFGPACVTLEKDATAALAFAPVPDAELEQPWLRAVTNSREAGQNCIAYTNGAAAAVSLAIYLIMIIGGIEWSVRGRGSSRRGILV
jgi:hypothetical protein